MSKNFVTFLTAQNCGHCFQTRGKGILNDGKVLNGRDFLENFFTLGVEITNIHYANMMGKKNDIKEVSKFYKKDNIIYQSKYTENNGYLRVETYRDKKGKTELIVNDFVFSKGSKILWAKFLREKIPNKLANYIFYFPCFLVIERKNWKEAILDDSKDLIAIPNAGMVVKDEKGNVGLNKSSDSLNKRNIDIIKLVQDIEKGLVKIEPMQVLENTKVKIKMLTQDIIEEFFLNMIAELRKDNIYILNDYGENFREYPYETDLNNNKEELDDDYYNSDAEN